MDVRRGQRTGRIVCGLCFAGTVFSSCDGTDAVVFDEEDAAFLDQSLQESLESHQVPGFVVLVTTTDGTIYRGAFGATEPSGATPMPDDALFVIASMSKPITALGVMMLVERGYLTLDEAAGNYVPALAGREVLVRVDTANGSAITRPASREITIRDLLRHTSGLGYAFSDERLFEYARYVDRNRQNHPLLHDPGERWTYSTGFDFLGQIIEVVSGRPLPDFFADEIFGPLGMTNTGFAVEETRAARLLPTVRRVDGVLSSDPAPDSISAFVSGGGGLVSTADDYARFLQLLLGGGERDGLRLLGSEAFAEMTRDQLEGLVVLEQPSANPRRTSPFPLGSGRDGFGLGMQVAVGEDLYRRGPGSLSWAGIRNTHFWVDPESGIGVLLLFQFLPFYDSAVVSVLEDLERALYGRLRAR